MNGCFDASQQQINQIRRFYSIPQTPDSVITPDVGMERSAVLIAPYDFRVQEVTPVVIELHWLSELYAYLKLRLGQFPLADKALQCAYGCREEAHVH